MKLFLIRHAESVDNVAQLYAGLRDSLLTNHGVLQAECLGQHLAARGLRFTDIFASDLKRAFKTADAIRLAQPMNDQRGLSYTLQILSTPLLREQDFGALEGVSYVASRQVPADVKVDLETKDRMVVRAEQFLDDYLIPVLAIEDVSQDPVVAVVSHGIFLNVLWRQLLRRFTPSSITAPPDILPADRRTSVEYLAWGNTAFLELDLGRALPHAGRQPGIPDNNIAPGTLPSPPVPLLSQWRLTLVAINARDHLTAIAKRTGGGIGSSRYDEGQKKIDNYFIRKVP
ncbi:MAG: hypothetical protein M1833_006750 [Piccolia ochrophora]|nr:MAG: hypothetical protein M1833_006750 [Piccolia ochrophora]